MLLLPGFSTSATSFRRNFKLLQQKRLLMRKELQPGPMKVDYSRISFAA